MSNKPEVKVTNHSSTSSVGYLLLLIFICWIMQMSGCDACQGTSSGTECAGKAIGETYKELKQGFEKGNK